MSRYMHFVADELRAAGHEVEQVFADELSRDLAGRFRRWIVPRRIVRLVEARLAVGKAYDVVDIHEPIAGAYARARRRQKSLPPCMACVYACESRALDARDSYASQKGRKVSMKSRWMGLLYRRQANTALRSVDHVTVETTEDHDFVVRLGVAPDRISYLLGGVEPGFFGPFADSRAGILFVGTWIERKGVLDLSQALTSLLARYRDLRVTLAGTGLSIEQVHADFPAELRDRITVLPKITDDRILEALYRSHAIFAFPSTFEGLPLVILEAAAAGLAIVTTRTCGMRDFVRDGQNGLLLDVGDFAALTQHLERLLTDSELTTRLAQAAQESARAYTWKRAAEQFLEAATACCGAGERP